MKKKITIGTRGSKLALIYARIAEQNINKFKSRSPLASQMIKRSINVLAYNNAIAVMHMDYDQFLLTQNYSDH